MTDQPDPGLDPDRIITVQITEAGSTMTGPASDVQRFETQPRKRDWHNVGTRVRTTRLSDDLWAEVQAEAERTGSTTSTIVRDALDAYLDRRP